MHQPYLYTLKHSVFYTNQFSLIKRTTLVDNNAALYHTVQ